MAYFECLVGGSGDGIKLIITCTEGFAGATITCTDGNDTYTEVCPSASPYTVTFEGLSAGTWTISGEADGETYSTTVTLADYEAELNDGFVWKKWVTFGGLDPDDYTDLADVFSDEAAVRRLMLVHASADYLIDCVTEDVDDIDDFCANDTAMKWLGLCDYVCDGLTAITGVEAKFLASQYWERYLKDHVPTMTSNTAPYGEASANSSGTNNPAWKAFNDSESNGWGCNSVSFNNYILKYTFINPIIPKKCKVKFVDGSSRDIKHTIQLLGSNDGGLTWDAISEEVVTGTINQYKEIDLTATQYYMTLGMKDINSPTGNNANAGDGFKLQFYGRSLNVSVPVMTSDTAPYGEAIATSTDGNNNHAAYKAFDGDNTSYWECAQNSSDVRISYHFSSAQKISKAFVKYGTLSSQDIVGGRVVKLQYSDDGTTWHDASDSIASSTTSFYIDSTERVAHEYWGLYYVSLSTSVAIGWSALAKLQFYGLDYSEKEFETGSTKKWLYDHGVELEPVITYVTDSTKGEAIKEESTIKASINVTSNKASAVCSFSVDLTDFSLLRTAIDNVYYNNNSQPPYIVVLSTSSPDTSTSSDAYKAVYMGENFYGNRYAIDVSSFNTEKYVGIRANLNQNLTLKILVEASELWLE